MNLDQQQKTRLAIALGAVVALVLGFSVLNKSDSGSNASASTAMRGQGMQNGQGPPGAQGGSGATGATGGGMGQGGPPNGGQGGPPQMTELTGTTRTKAVAAAKTKASGTVDHAFEAPNGSGYVVIFEKSDGTHVGVQVSKEFKVTGTRTMQMGPGGQGEGQGGPPAGAQQQGTNTQ
ncbi:MAG: hypothetical protein JHC98_06530 [Thermoleophilaceae bacterium]|nr:hypothetical protein [Thermoleophilaceae bacterium]